MSAIRLEGQAPDGHRLAREIIAEAGADLVEGEGVEPRQADDQQDVDRRHRHGHERDGLQAEAQLAEAVGKSLLPLVKGVGRQLKGTGAEADCKLTKHLDQTDVGELVGSGDELEPEYDLMAIGSGGPYAQAAARALLDNTELPARDIVERGLNIAGDICIYTNTNISLLELEAEGSDDVEDQTD